jgi:predicted regulator of Ras-like GTPase activity (Roadblock/LC7/MglB family)
MLGRMDAARAIAEMTDISPQVREVVVIGADGAVVGSNAADDARASRLADGARRLLDAAEPEQPGVAQLEAATVAGSVFVVRDGERVIAATTSPEPTVGLVFYDLKTCLRSIDEPKPKARRRKAQTGESHGEEADGPA